MAAVRSSSRGKRTDTTINSLTGDASAIGGRGFHLTPMVNALTGRSTWFLNLGGGMEFDDLDAANEWLEGYRSCGAQQAPGRLKSYDLKIHPISPRRPG